MTLIGDVFSIPEAAHRGDQDAQPARHQRAIRQLRSTLRLL